MKGDACKFLFASVLIEPGGARASVRCTAPSTVALYDLQTLTLLGKIDAGWRSTRTRVITAKPQSTDRSRGSKGALSKDR